jgi:hypothetical protein
MGAVMGALLFVGATLPAESVATLSSGRDEKTLEIKSFKRGLFFGSCGPSTRSLQWEYTFRLRGPGPRYPAAEIQLKDGSLAPIPVAGGEISIDPARRSATILIHVRHDTAEEVFPHNGQYKIKSTEKQH